MRILELSLTATLEFWLVMPNRSQKMLTVREAAEVARAAPSTIRTWLLAGLIPGARREQSPAGTYWLIPETSLGAFVKPKLGRPRKPLSELKGRPRRKD